MSNTPNPGSRSPNDIPPAAPAATEGNTAAGGSMLLAQLRGGEGHRPESALSAKPKRFSSHNTITMLVLVVSAIMLYGMRQAGMRSGMTFKEVKIDYQKEDVSPAALAAQRRILQDLQRSERPFQVPVERLAKNPFELGTMAPSGPVSEDRSLADAQRQAELARQSREERAQKVQTALAGLELRGVMEGRVPLARINDQTVRVGDSVADLFKVAKIDGRSVDLTADGQTYTLQMSEAKQQSPGGPVTKTGRATSGGGGRPR